MLRTPREPGSQSIRLLHYLAYLPQADFGMSEEAYVTYASTFEPRSLVLARLRDELGWEVSVHTLTANAARTVAEPPLNIPFVFHEPVANNAISCLEGIGFVRRRAQRLRGARGLLNLLRACPPDLFVFRGNMFSMFSHRLGTYMRRMHIPYVYENHGSGIVVSPALRPFLLAARKLIVLNRQTASALVNGYGVGGAAVEVISNGVSTDLFRPLGMPRYGFPRLAFSGRLSREKGFDIAIECFREISRNWPEATLEVAGAPFGDSQPFFERVLGAMMPEERARTKFLGWLDKDDLLSFYNRADVLLFPSRISAEGHGEGEPRTVLEAMSCGLSVAAITGSGGHCEIVVRSGTGVVSEDAASFPVAVVRYLKDTHRMEVDRGAARRFIVERHSIDATFAKYARCCREAMSEPCPA